MRPVVPDFSAVAAEYAASRPAYPPELFQWLASSAAATELAWDAAAGNGQAAVGLAAHFTRVIATDRSASQIQNAMRHPRIEYRVASAEASGLSADSVDLVAVATAIHWFDLPRFYEEVRRVIRDGGILAAWSYHVAHVGPPLDKILWPFYRDVVGPHFADGARMVDARYEGLSLPGEPLPPPSLGISVRWTSDQVLRFVRTWSGVQAFTAATREDPVREIEGAVRDALGGGDSPATLTWPLYIRASRLRRSP
ncbi:MAG: class I SAM-dependent methyltransferase [Vicinamibacterales bacterium]